MKQHDKHVYNKKCDAIKIGIGVLLHLAELKADENEWRKKIYVPKTPPINTRITFQPKVKVFASPQTFFFQFWSIWMKYIHRSPNRWNSKPCLKPINLPWFWIDEHYSVCGVINAISKKNERKKSGIHYKIKRRKKINPSCKSVCPSVAVLNPFNTRAEGPTNAINNAKYGFLYYWNHPSFRFVSNTPAGIPRKSRRPSIPKIKKDRVSTVHGEYGG